MPLLGEASTEDGVRIYAIGDVHGCLDLLKAMHARIAADLTANPIADHVIVHLGDLVDRGPNSAGVLDYLIEASAADNRVMALMGNHEHQFLRFLRKPAEAGPLWMTYGGVETLGSYGVHGGHSGMDERELSYMRDAALPRIPDHHISFMQSLPLMVRSGDFLFVHAGIRPGVALADQDDHDLLYIRQPFLDAPGDLGAVVIHGHTPIDRPDIRPNRINIDTGAVFNGALTCVVVEGPDHRLIAVPATRR